MRIDWAFNRLRTMEPAEIVHRIQERLKQIWSKNRHEGWTAYCSSGPAPELAGLREELLSLAQSNDASLADSVAKSLAGQYQSLGQKWPQRTQDDLFPESFWRLDPVTGQLWPGAETYYFDISYRHETTLGDIKYVWDVNRLQFLQPLALKVFLDQSSASLAAIETCIQSWYAANPAYRGVAWNSGIEIALRAISLLVISSLVGDQLSQTTVEKLRAILKASLFWLQRFPSRYSSANNHLIGEVTGEYLIALALPFDRDRDVMRAAQAKLEAEALKQFLADGTPAEQSPSYGAFSAELLHVAHSAAPLDASVQLRLENFSRFIFAIDSGSGELPGIGDDDEGFVLDCGDGPRHHTHKIARRLGFASSSVGIRTFAQGGYSVFKDDQWHLIFDHGPLGYLSIAAHGHADALAITLSYKGRPIFVDPGTYLYHSGGNWRDWFRGTSAHNTLSIDGVNQSRIAGPFNWLNKAHAKLEQAELGPNWKLSASHDGYKKQFGVNHRRRIESRQGMIVVCDHLMGSNEAVEASINFQLAIDLSVTSIGNTCCISVHGKPVIDLVFPVHGIVQIFCGAAPEEGGGWVSPSFGIKIEAPRIVWTGEVGAAGVEIIIRPASDCD